MNEWFRSDFRRNDQWPDVTDERVRAAFAAVPREAFIAPELRQYAGDDAPLPIGQGQTISQPYVVALMVQSLALGAGTKVLEIGTGSGYETAILCTLTEAPERPLGENIYAIERLEQLADQASMALHSLGYWPHLRVGDGAAGWPEEAPFEAIIVSAAASHIPRPLWDQLADGGRMVLPRGADANDQELWLLHKRAGAMHRENLGGVRFVPLISPLLQDPANWAESQDVNG
ncbi:MAG: protein-L-isoaspartate(D-aspartate) O-methyltransferase [Caldilineaceae bacterium]